MSKGNGGRASFECIPMQSMGTRKTKEGKMTEKIRKSRFKIKPAYGVDLR
jgi:hypothetical protein